jgi:hypothetical protein
MAWSVSSWTIGDEDAERNSERIAASDGGHGRRTLGEDEEGRDEVAGERVGHGVANADHADGAYGEDEADGDNGGCCGRGRRRRAART